MCEAHDLSKLTQLGVQCLILPSGLKYSHRRFITLATDPVQQYNSSSDVWTTGVDCRRLVSLSLMLQKKATVSVTSKHFQSSLIFVVTT